MSQKSILLVEYDINLRQSIALILQRVGYSVTATDCIDRALELLQHNGYHLLLSDINSPESDDSWLPQVIALHPNISIAILTDESSVEVEWRKKRFNVHYFVKPVAPENLLDYVGAILGKSSAFNLIAYHRLPQTHD